MPSDVKEIHLICRGALHVANDGADFLSGNWALSANVLKPGVVIALHEKASSKSYRQGVLVGIEKSIPPEKPRTRTRYVLRVRSTEKPLPWKGKQAFWRSFVRD